MVVIWTGHDDQFTDGLRLGMRNQYSCSLGFIATLAAPSQ
jgi:hypothetical protein